MTLQLNIAFIRKLHGSLICLADFFDLYSVGVSTARHWQTSGRLVQELSVLYHICIVMTFFQQPEEFYFDDVFHPDIDQEQHMKLQTSFHDSKNMDPQLSPLPIVPGQRQYASGTACHFSSLRFYNYYHKLRDFRLWIQKVF